MQGLEDKLLELLKSNTNSTLRDRMMNEYRLLLNGNDLYNLGITYSYLYSNNGYIHRLFDDLVPHALESKDDTLCRLIILWYNGVNRRIDSNNNTSLSKYKFPRVVISPNDYELLDLFGKDYDGD